MSVWPYSTVLCSCPVWVSIILIIKTWMTNSDIFSWHIQPGYHMDTGVQDQCKIYPHEEICNCTPPGGYLLGLGISQMLISKFYEFSFNFWFYKLKKFLETHPFAQLGKWPKYIIFHEVGDTRKRCCSLHRCLGTVCCDCKVSWRISSCFWRKCKQKTADPRKCKQKISWVKVKV